MLSYSLPGLLGLDWVRLRVGVRTVERSERDAMRSRDGRRWLESCGRLVWVRTVCMLVEEMEDNEGDEDGGGELMDALDRRRGRVRLTVDGNGVVVSENTLLSLWRAILRSVCRLFWNHTVTERSSLEATRKSCG